MYKFTLLLMSLLSFFGCASLPSDAVQSVSASAFAKMIEHDPKMFRLDVRSTDEYAAGHVPGSINIDVLQPDFSVQARERLPKGHRIALYCRSGRRSQEAARILSSMGFRVLELSSGFLGWQAEGLPVER